MDVAFKKPPLWGSKGVDTFTKKMPDISAFQKFKGVLRRRLGTPVLTWIFKKNIYGFLRVVGASQSPCPGFVLDDMRLISEDCLAQENRR